MKKKLLLILLMLTAMATAVGLDGRTVILLVSEHRDGDPRMDAVRNELLKVRKDLGYSKEEMPIVFMGFRDSDTERQYFDRLGFQSFDSPVLCVAEWGNPGRFGPKKVVDYAIARSATPQHVEFIVQNYLKTIGQQSGPITKPSPVPPPPSTVGPPPVTPNPEQQPGQIDVISARFEASGKPLFMTNVGIKIQNTDDHTLRDLTIRFYSRLQETDEWRLMGKKTLQKLPKGYFASREIVGDTQEYQLVDDQGNAVRCFYRIEVEHAGKVITEEGEFIPSEGPVGMIDL